MERNLADKPFPLHTTNALFSNSFNGDATTAISEFVHDAGIALSTQFMHAVRTQLATTGGTPPAGVATSPARPSPSIPAVPAQGTRSALSFKAAVLDENSNLIFEGGERILVRIGVVNGGEQELQGVTASLTGTAAVLAQFSTTTLVVGTLQPGQSRSIEFVATLPQSSSSRRPKSTWRSLMQEPYSAARRKP
jgi:hypothetical protein